MRNLEIDKLVSLTYLDYETIGTKHCYFLATLSWPVLRVPNSLYIAEVFETTPSSAMSL